MRPLRNGLFLALTLVSLWAPSADGALQTIRGKLFDLAEHPVPLKRLKVEAREPASPNTVVGNPVLSGATLLVVVNGANPSTQSFPAPAAYWTPMAGGFRYDVPNNVPGALRRARIWKPANNVFRIRAFVHGGFGPVALALPNAGTDAGIRLTLDGGGDTYCVNFGGLAGGTISVNDDQRFRIKLPGLVEAGCPRPGDSPCGATCCGAERIVAMGGVATLTMGPYPPIAIAAGSTLAVDVGPADGPPSCRHEASVPAGGFSVPNFCIPVLGMTVQVLSDQCSGGTMAGVGTVWDGNACCPDADVAKLGDTTFGCGTFGTGCTAAPGGAGGDQLGYIDVDRGDLACDAGGAQTRLDIPIRLFTWVNLAGLCPDPDGVFDPGTDEATSDIPVVLSPTTASASAGFFDPDGDSCNFAGQGPAGLSPITGTPAPGACCQVGDGLTLAMEGILYTGYPGFGDVLFEWTTPFTVTACNPATTPGTCSWNPCLGN
ncbi:MAG TPA: hypothetical protein VKA21_04020 [Candidatus Binatia bacterium]|nr:hypothetical protein [Candidatus Binatia bacterium]